MPHLAINVTSNGAHNYGGPGGPMSLLKRLLRSTQDTNQLLDCRQSRELPQGDDAISSRAGTLLAFSLKPISS